MYFFPLNTIPVLVCPYWYKKRLEIQKTENRKTVITRTLAGLRTSIRRQKLPFSMLFQMVIGALGIFQHRFFYEQFYDFPTVFCIFRLFFAWYPDSDLGFGFLVEFYIDYSGAHVFFYFFPLLYNRENTRCKNAKSSFFAREFAQTWFFRHFCIMCILDYTKVKKNL